ncbi:ATP-binding protein [Desertibaculum subflavum]|uniref:ATP-binding protein n=1 Tax=Desertibaculum subflavum TaxID=2268458 RepID=UPI0013C52E0D
MPTALIAAAMCLVAVVIAVLAAHTLLDEGDAAHRARDLVAMGLAGAGMALSIMAIVLLIRSHRRARVGEREAEEINARLRLLADTLPGLVSYLDTEVRYRFMNSRYRDWFDIDPDDFLGRTPEEVAGPAAGALFRGWVTTALTGEPVSTENVAPFERGPPRPVRCYLVPDRDGNGRVRGVVSLTIDVTREHETMRALEEARDQAVEASRAKSRFLAAASHDLRQPLYALTLFASALERRLKQADAADLVRNIQQAARSMQSMFNSLLDISKLDAGVTMPRVTTFPAAEVLRKLEAEFRGRAEARGLAFRFVPSAVPVRSDPELLESILRNLLSNAVKFTASGRVLLGCRRAGTRLRIEVHDSGPGIPPEQMPRLFQEFAQGQTQKLSGETGLGLGLAIVQRLARLLGHEVAARSMPGRGATFTVAVPMAAPVDARPADAAPAGPDPAGAVDLAGRHVLVVEDEPEVRAALARLLGDWGMRVSEAGDADGAAAALSKGTPPDLVLADYNLGSGPNGLDVVRRIERQVGRRVPALVVTGATGPETLVTLKASGIPWATKPLEPATLKARIGAAMYRAAAE